MAKGVSQKKLDKGLIKSLEKEDLSLAEKFLKAGANSNHYQTNIFTKDRSTASIVMGKDHLKMLQLLITYGFDQNQTLEILGIVHVPLILFSALHDNKKTLKLLAEDIKTDFNIEYSSTNLVFELDMANEEQLLTISRLSASTLAIIKNAVPIRAEKERALKQQKIRDTKFKF